MHIRQRYIDQIVLIKVVEIKCGKDFIKALNRVALMYIIQYYNTDFLYQ